jgi:hypothetical protein
VTTFALLNNNNDTVSNSSEDGTTYTARTDIQARWSSVIHCKSLSKFFAINGNGGASNWQQSGDGHSWTSITRFGAHYSAGWSNDLGIAVVHLDTNHATKEMAWSTDLTNWTAVAADSTQNVRPAGGTGGHSIAWSKELTLFVAVGNALGTHQFTTSPDGKVWTSNTAASVNYTSVAWGGDGAGGGPQIFIGAFTNSGSVGKSSSGTGGWTTEATAGSVGTPAIAYSPSLNRFCLVGSNGGCQTREGGGTTWTSRGGGSGLSSHVWKDICWSTELSLFCVIATGGQIATSPDGITWTDRTPSSAGIIWQSIAVSETSASNVTVDMTLAAVTYDFESTVLIDEGGAMTLSDIQMEADVSVYLDTNIAITLQAPTMLIAVCATNGVVDISLRAPTILASVHVLDAVGNKTFYSWWNNGP